MIKLRNLLNQHGVSVLNKAGLIKGPTVDERAAYRAMVTKADSLQKEWKALYADFKDRIEDAEVKAGLEKEWNKDLPDLKKLPASILDRLAPEATMDEMLALEDLCEKPE